MLIVNEVSIFSNSKNPSDTSVFDILLFNWFLVTIFSTNFCINTQCFHFHLWKVAFPFEAYPSIYCYNPTRACCKMVHIGDRHSYRNQCDCFLILVTNLLYSFCKLGHICDSFSHDLCFTKVYSLKAQWVYKLELDGLEIISAPIYVSFLIWQACLSQQHRHMQALPQSWKARESGSSRGAKQGTHYVL